ncbi:MAG: hypothetical protein AAGL10_15755, partial [Pseudomonadota bacterium]
MPKTQYSVSIPRTIAHGFGAIGAAIAVLALPVPAAAQDSSEARLRKIEAEIRALQRNVFPGSDGRFFEPQISPEGTPVSTAANGTARPSTT